MLYYYHAPISLQALVLSFAVVMLALCGCGGKKGGGNSSESPITWLNESKIESLDAEFKVGYYGDPPTAGEQLQMCVSIMKDGRPIKDLKVEYLSGYNWVKKPREKGSLPVVIAGAFALEFYEAKGELPAHHGLADHAPFRLPYGSAIKNGKYPVRFLIENAEAGSVDRALDHGIELDVKEAASK